MTVAAAAILRHAYGANAAKKIARDFAISVPAAKVWLAGRFPQARTLELIAMVEPELARIEARNTEIRRQLGLGGRRGSRAQSNEAGGGAGGITADEYQPPSTGLRGPVNVR